MRRLALMDGRSVTTRPCDDGDADRIAALIAALSPESRAMRFGMARRGLTADEARRMAAPPGPSGAGFVALSGGDGEDGPILGLARYERAPGSAEGELAVAVSDAWHGLGLGTVLLRRLIDRAAADGLDALWALVRTDNHRMLRVLRSLGAESRTPYEPGERVLRIALGAGAGGPTAGRARGSSPRRLRARPDAPARRGGAARGGTWPAGRPAP